MKKDIVFDLIAREKKRQRDVLEMIPSENFASREVMRAVGSVMMNKYAEGQVGRRYYQGMELADQVEALCKARALELFGLDCDEWGVNVQPYSGSPANFAILASVLEPMKGKIMAMCLAEGGHLSHGWEFRGKKVSLSSKFWQVEYYFTDKKTRVFDYDEILKRARRYKPDVLISGGTAYPRDIKHKLMGAIAREVGAYYLADVSHEAGLIAAGELTSPFVSADFVMMTTHKTLRGPRGALIFARRKAHRARGVEDLSRLVDFTVFPGLQGGPHLHTIAGIAVALEEAGRKSFKRYSRQVIGNAKVLASELKKYGFDVVSGGTDKHLVLVDLRDRELSGWVVAWALEAVGIVVNRNTVPHETASPFYPSGFRLGTPAVTTRGMKEREMRMIAGWIKEVVDCVGDKRLPEGKVARRRFSRRFLKEVVADKELKKVGREVRGLCRKFPLKG